MGGVGAARELRDALGKTPPKGLAGALSEEQLADLARAVSAARERQSAELRAAIDGAFDGVPRLLRGPLRKVLLG